MAMAPAFTNAAATVVGIWAIERVGRRKLLLSSLVSVSAILAIIGLLFNASSRHTPAVYSGVHSAAYNSCPVAAQSCNGCVNSQCLFCGMEKYSEQAFKVPVTKGLTFDEIQDVFSRRLKVIWNRLASRKVGMFIH